MNEIFGRIWENVTAANDFMLMQSQNQTSDEIQKSKFVQQQYFYSKIIDCVCPSLVTGDVTLVCEDNCLLSTFYSILLQISETNILVKKICIS